MTERQAAQPADGITGFRARADRFLIGALGAHLLLCLVVAAMTDT